MLRTGLQVLHHHKEWNQIVHAYCADETSSAGHTSFIIIKLLTLYKVKRSQIQDFVFFLHQTLSFFFTSSNIRC